MCALCVKELSPLFANNITLPSFTEEILPWSKKKGRRKEKKERRERKRKEKITLNKRPRGNNYRNTASSALARKLQPFHCGSKAILF